MAEVGRDLRTAFHAALDDLDDRFVAAGLRVAESLPRLSEAFLLGDASIIEQSEFMAWEVASECEQIEDDGFVLLAREAPVASDLRRLVALLRMTVDVSRSASLLRHACLTLRQFDPRFLDPPLRAQLEELSRVATEVFVAGLDAWRRRDALAVNEVDRADDAVDELQRLLLGQASNVEDPGTELVVLGLLARYYERIADHGVEVARDATFVATGQRVLVGRTRLPPFTRQDEPDDLDVGSDVGEVGEVGEPGDPGDGYPRGSGEPDGAG